MAANGSGSGSGKVAADFEKLIHEGMYSAHRLRTWMGCKLAAV
jgi:hypothetical protein